MASDVSDDEGATPPEEMNSISSTVRQRLRARLLQKQSEKVVQHMRDHTQSTRFDEPLPSSHPHSSHLSQVGRGTSLGWRLLSERLPEAIERTLEEQSYHFFTGTADDLEYPELPQRVQREGGWREGGRRGEGQGDVEEEGEGSREGEGEGEMEGGEREGVREVEEEEGGCGVTGSTGEQEPVLTEEDGTEGDNGGGIHGDEVHNDTIESSFFRGQSPIQWLRPPTTVYIPQRVRLGREEDVYFTPSTQPTGAEEKTPSGLLPRYRDDEGLYVGQRPRVKWTNQITVENRLLQRHDQGRGWFGADGLLHTLPNPLLDTHIRPALLAYDPTQNFTLAPVRREAVNQKLIPPGPSSYRLDLTLTTLHFSHHPLFTLEHVLSSQLKLFCRQYTELIDNRVTDYILHRLYALKTAAVDLKHSLNDLDSCRPEAVEVKSTLHHYTSNIRALRRERREREASKYTLLQAILRLWSVLKRVREDQGYSNTPLCISFKRVAVDGGEELAVLQREIEEEVEEEREQYVSELPEREALYHTQLAEWKALRKMRKRTIRNRDRLLRLQQMAEEGGEERESTKSGEEEEGREGGREEGEAESSGGGREGEEGGEEGSGSVRGNGSHSSLGTDSASGIIPEEGPQPIPPAPFDPDHCRHEIADFYRHHIRPPGEPILIPLLQNTHSISHHCPRVEQMRRMEVSRLKLKLRVFYNDTEVSTTTECSMTQDFHFHFDETFHIEISQWPESLKIQVLECSLFSSTVLAEIFIPIPDSQQSSHSAIPVSYQFSNDRVSAPRFTAVGSGETLPSFPEAGVLVTSGEVSVRVCWSEDEEGRVMCPPGLQSHKEHSPKTTNLKALKKWAEEARLDPNDPRNMKFLHLLQSVPTTTDESVAKVFRLKLLHEKERLVSDEEFARERRFALLEHRHRGHPHLKNKSIPMNKENITGSLWKAVQEYQPYKDYELPPTYQGDFHGSRREERNRFLLEVRERVLSKVRSGRKKLQIDDVIHYDIIPNISGLKRTLLELISPRRPLKPRRKPTRRAKTQNLQVSEARILVRVVRAFKVPVRIQHSHEHSHPPVHGISVASPRSPFHNLTSHHLPSQDDDVMGSPPYSEGLHTVSPYVEVSIGEFTQRTTTSSGPNPFWNEELSLPFQPPYGDFSPSNLAKVTDDIQFNLFDEIIVDLLQDDRERNTNIHQRREKKWLGSFSLPFSTLHARARIEGTFSLEVPKLLLGYDKSVPSPEGEGSDHTHLQLFISLEPPLSTLPPIRDLFTSSEEPHLLRHANQWIKNLHNTHPDCHYLATALDSSGHHVFVSRYIHPQSPPVQLCPTGDTDQRHSMELLAHYVSLIPFLPDAITFSGECDIWTTSEQFLHMLAGDEEEHAVLLANYFLHCGWPAWLVLGTGIPEGPTAYVLTRAVVEGGEGISYWLWNASTGRHTTQYDPHCPLTSVGCVISKENVWANVQEYSEPGRIVFDLANTKHWKPLFPSSMEPLETIQRDLVYDETDQARVRDLQDSIEREVRGHVMSLRTRFITRWNNNCGRTLHKMLIRYEEHLSDPETFQDTSELEEIMTSYTLSGYPLHFPYANILHIISSIENTGLHLTEDRRAQFALSVYVHPYPNDVISVWVFLVTLVPK